MGVVDDSAPQYILEDQCGWRQDTGWESTGEIYTHVPLEWKGNIQGFRFNDSEKK